MGNIIRTYLKKKKLQEKPSCDDYILSLSEALKQLHCLMREEVCPKELIKLIGKEALKQGMILHFDTQKKRPSKVVR